MLRIYFGEEDFLINQSVQKTKIDFIKKNPQALVEVFDGDESQVEDFFHSLNQGGGLFFEKKMIILKNVFSFNKSDQEKILDFLKTKFNFSGETDLIITWNGKMRSSRLMTFLKKQNLAKEFKKITPLEIEKFTLNKLKNISEIDKKAIQRLGILFVGNLWLLDREIEKLINYKNGDKITENDVDKMCEGGTSVKIFDLVDALGGRNKKRAFELLDSLLNQGEDGFYVLSMVVFQARNLALVSDCREKEFTIQRRLQKRRVYTLM